MSIYQSALLNKKQLEETIACQYIWGVRAGHRDELILRDSSATDSESSGEFLNERLWCLMDYYDPTSIVDNSGAVVERYRFSAFGLRSILAPDFSPRMASDYAWDFAFKGQFLDLDTGYYDYGYRYYSPELGRWLSRDPIGENGGFNLYAIALNNLINRIDLLGQDSSVELYQKDIRDDAIGYSFYLKHQFDPILKNDVVAQFVAFTYLVKTEDGTLTPYTAYKVDALDIKGKLTRNDNIAAPPGAIVSKPGNKSPICSVTLTATATVVLLPNPDDYKKFKTEKGVFFNSETVTEEEFNKLKALGSTPLYNWNFSYEFKYDVETQKVTADDVKWQN